MEYRSTNNAFVHYLGDITSNVDSSHGVQLTGGSTGGFVQAVGDDGNITLTILPKGTGKLVLGTSSNALQVAQTFTVQYAPAQLAASTSAASTITVTGLLAGRPLLFTPTTPGLSPAYTYRVQCSTADELRFTEGNLFGSTIGTGESTARGILIQL